MFTRHLIAAAALMAATCAANADVITTTSTVTTDSTMASDMSIVDTSTALTGADTGLAAVLASSTTAAQLVLVRGVEGNYMLASRINAPVQSATDAQSTVPAAGTTTTAADLGSTGGSTGSTTGGSSSADISLPVTNADLPTAAAADVPEPATLTLMLAGLLGAVAFTRARKQG